MKKLLTILTLVLAAATLQAKDYKVLSPSGELSITIQADDSLRWSIGMGEEILLEPSPLSLTLADGTVYGSRIKVRKAVKKSVSQTLEAQNFKRAQVEDRYNELTLQTKDFDVIFRVYDDGAAYRFVSKKAITVASEEAVFNFPEDHKAWIPYVRDPGTFEEQFFNSFENHCTVAPISEWDPKRLAFLPLTLDGTSHIKLCITESDLRNYPGMYLLNSDAGTSLHGVFAPVPKEIEQGGHNMLQAIVKSREPFIYRGEAPEALPWRIVIVAKEDRLLAQSDMVWRLSAPAEGDFSWVKPGKVAWDWWNDWNIKGVDFESGVNNDTYKYYIDFASHNGIEYVT